MVFNIKNISKKEKKSDLGCILFRKQNSFLIENIRRYSRMTFPVNSSKGKRLAKRQACLENSVRK